MDVKSWHKMPSEKQEHFDMFLVWLGLPYEDPPKERTVREIYHRKTGANGNPSSHYFRVRDDNLWLERATNYDAHRQALIQQAEDEAFTKAVGEIAEKEAISVERMRVEVANFFDDISPILREAIKDKLRRIKNGEEDVSMQGLVQLGRLWMDMFKVLDKDDDGWEPEDYTDEEWERLLSSTPPAQEDPEIKSPLEEGPEGTETSGAKDAPQDPTDI